MEKQMETTLQGLGFREVSWERGNVGGMRKGYIRDKGKENGKHYFGLNVQG